MDQIELKVTSREILGKKVRFLRRRGITPVHVFGRGIESAALQCDTVNLRRVLTEAGHTRLISLTLDKENMPRNVVVRQIQREPRSGETLHVDFYQVQMAALIKMEIPIILVGEAPALKEKGNKLVQEFNTLAVECLPALIPDSVVLDITGLTETDQVVRVKDIELDEGITVLDNPELVVGRISSRLIEKEEVVAVAAEEAGEAVAGETPEEASEAG